MNTVFVGGSRNISRLPEQVKDRLNNIINSGAKILIGDANGIDKAVQKYLIDNQYKNVSVFCSGNNYRNNLGNWKTYCVDTPESIKGFQFYAFKDREMAKEADFGLMIWDGKSVGTILNILRLIQARKKAVLVNVKEKNTTNFKAIDDWKSFIITRSLDLRKDISKRATPEEIELIEIPKQANFLDIFEKKLPKASTTPKIIASLEDELNAALETGDIALLISRLGDIAKIHGMSHIAKDTGLARESLYRSLSSEGNPEFSTIYKVMSSIGLRLAIHRD